MPASATHHDRSRHVSPPAGAGHFDVMDDTLTLILTIGSPIAAIALAWGGARWQLKHLAERDQKREADFETFREQDRVRSHELNLKLAAALESQAMATGKMLDFEARRGDQIDRNTYRSRSNRTRIELLEDHDRDAALRRLRDAGVPPELHEEITGVVKRAPENSAVLPRAEAKR